MCVVCDECVLCVMSVCVMSVCCVYVYACE